MDRVEISTSCTTLGGDAPDVVLVDDTPYVNAPTLAARTSTAVIAQARASPSL